MPSISNQDMTLPLVGGNKVAITVVYNANFSVFERFLYQNGLIFDERIRIYGRDETIDALLYTFPSENIHVPPGGTPVIIPRNRVEIVERDLLQEDVGSNTDEIVCKIEIIPRLPERVTVTTSVKLLAG